MNRDRAERGQTLLDSWAASVHGTDAVVTLVNDYITSGPGDRYDLRSTCVDMMTDIGHTLGSQSRFDAAMKHNTSGEGKTALAAGLLDCMKDYLVSIGEDAEQAAAAASMHLEAELHEANIAKELMTVIDSIDDSTDAGAAARIAVSFLCENWTEVLEDNPELECANINLHEDVAKTVLLINELRVRIKAGDFTQEALGELEQRDAEHEAVLRAVEHLYDKPLYSDEPQAMVEALGEVTELVNEVSDNLLHSLTMMVLNKEDAPTM